MTTGTTITGNQWLRTLVPVFTFMDWSVSSFDGSNGKLVVCTHCSAEFAASSCPFALGCRLSDCQVSSPSIQCSQSSGTFTEKKAVIAVTSAFAPEPHWSRTWILSGLHGIISGTKYTCTSGFSFTIFPNKSRAAEMISVTDFPVLTSLKTPTTKMRLILFLSI